MTQNISGFTELAFMFYKEMFIQAYKRRFTFMHVYVYANNINTTADAGSASLARNDSTYKL